MDNPSLQGQQVNPKNNYLLLVGLILFFSFASALVCYYFGRNLDENIVPIPSTPVVVQSSPSPTIEDSTPSIPQGWKYTLSQQQTNANECVKVALPPMEPPYVYTLDENRQPSVTEDKGSGRFWYIGGTTYPNLLSKILDTDEEYKQTMALFATETEASGYISQAVAVTCIPNKKLIKDNTQLNSNLDAALKSYNNSTEEKGMQAQKYILQKSDMTKRWGKDVIDYTVNEDSKIVQYTMFVTPKYIYEVRILGASPDSFIKETAQKIFNNLNFN